MPTAQRTKICIIASKACMFGSKRSIPMSTICVSGRDVTMRPLPSLVRMLVDPVEAMAKLQPVMPISAARNFWRSFARAKSVIS